jgi:hypothetical protein
MQPTPQGVGYRPKQGTSPEGPKEYTLNETKQVMDSEQAMARGPF